MTSPFTATSRVRRRDWVDLVEKYPRVLERAVLGGVDRAVLFAESTRRVRHRLTQVVRGGRPSPPRFRRDERHLEGSSITADRRRELLLKSAGDLDTGTLLEIASQMSGPRSAQALRAQIPSTIGSDFDLRPLLDNPSAMPEAEAAESLRMAAEFVTGLVSGVQGITIDIIEKCQRSLVACADIAGGDVTIRRDTRLSLVVNCVLEDGRKLRAVRGSRAHPDEWARRAGEAAARELSVQCDITEAVAIGGPTVMPVLFEAGWCAGVWVHEVVGHALEADNIEQGWSALGDLRGKKVTTTSLTIIDSPGDADLPGFMEADDEAVFGWDTVLVDGGLVSGVINDRRTAAFTGTEATGNGRRQDYRYPAQPRMTNLIVRRGASVPLEVATRIPRCLRVKSMSRGNLDGRSGVFTFPVDHAEMLVYGEAVSSMRGVTVSGASLEALASVAAVGSDVKSDEGRGRCLKNGQIVDVGMRCPSILIEELTIVPTAA